jgi:hypothetical protein
MTCNFQIGIIAICSFLIRLCYLDILRNCFVEYYVMSTGSGLLTPFYKIVRSKLCNRLPVAIAGKNYIPVALYRIAVRRRRVHIGGEARVRSRVAWDRNIARAFWQDQLSIGLVGRTGRRMHCSAFNKKHTNED